MARALWLSTIVTAVVVMSGARAHAVALREVRSHVTESTVIIDAPPEEIYAVITDYANWQQIFSDVLSVKVKAGAREDATIEFKSRAFDHRSVPVKFDNVRNRLIRFRGLNGPPSGRTWGEYVLTPIGDGSRTQVTARLYVNVVGPASVLYHGSKVTRMRRNKLGADLSDATRWFEQHRRPHVVRAGA
jgi:uncharacterized protein YndB with AHSA1/START domain